jgi:hypothetical protein
MALAVQVDVKPFPDLFDSRITGGVDVVVELLPSLLRMAITCCNQSWCASNDK